jgi:hypothetical protein
MMAHRFGYFVITTDSVEKDFSFPWEFHSGGGIIIFSASLTGRSKNYSAAADPLLHISPGSIVVHTSN